MKIELVKNTQAEKEEINWNRPHIVKHISKNIIILTTGKTEKALFSGVCIYDDRTNDNATNTYSEAWSKQSYKPLDKGEEIILKYSND